SGPCRPPVLAASGARRHPARLQAVGSGAGPGLRHDASKSTPRMSASAVRRIQSGMACSEQGAINRLSVEAALVERERSLFNLDATIYLYDLTSTYFEGQC